MTYLFRTNDITHTIAALCEHTQTGASDVSISRVQQFKALYLIILLSIPDDYEPVRLIDQNFFMKTYDR